MRYILWILVLMCQIGNLVCLKLNEKNDTNLKSKKTLHIISVLLQSIATLLLLCLIFGI